MHYLNQLTLWHWLVLGIIFLGVELCFSRGYFFWLSVVAGVVGAVKSLVPAFSVLAQCITFVVLAVISEWMWVKIIQMQAVLRRPSQDNYNIAKEMIGKTFALQKSVKNGYARIVIEGRIWRLRCKTELPAGTTVKVIGHDGVILLCEKA